MTYREKSGFYNSVNYFVVYMLLLLPVLTDEAGGALDNWRGWKTDTSLKCIKNKDQAGGAAAPKPTPWIRAWMMVKRYTTIT